MSHSLMKPSPPASPPLSPHLSFPPSAFQIVQLPGSLPLNMPMVNPTPIQPTTMTNQQIPLLFSTFWNPFTFEMYQQFPQLEASPSDIWSTNYLEQAYHNAPFTSPPNPSWDVPYWQNSYQPHSQGNNITMKHCCWNYNWWYKHKIEHGITTQQQHEINHQLHKDCKK